MTLFFDTFAVPRAQNSLQIIQYSGPPKPKQTSSRHPSKAPSSKDSKDSNTKLENKEDPVTMLDSVKVIDLTRLAGEGKNKISGSAGEGDDGVGSYDDFAAQNETEDEEFERTSQEGTGDESPNQPAPSRKINQEKTVVVKDSQPNSNTDSGDLYENDADTQKGDRLESSSVSILDRRGWVCPTTDTEDFTNSDGVDEVKTELSRPKIRKFPPKSLISSLKTTLEQSTQVKLHTMKDTGSSSSGDTDDDNNEDHSDQTAQPIRKRKRFLSTERHVRSSNTTLKQHLKHNAYSAKQRKLSPPGSNPLPNHHSFLEHVSTPPCSGINAKDWYSDDSGDESSEDHVRNPESNKRPMSTVSRSPARKHKRKRNRDTAEEDDEYEVENILNARVSRKKLQYRVKWLGYKDDPKWYNASNFKNSPHKLRDFHLLNPTSSGPPKRLERWIKCWEEDSNTDDHSDDNKAQD